MYIINSFSRAKSNENAAHECNNRDVHANECNKMFVIQYHCVSSHTKYQQLTHCSNVRGCQDIVYMQCQGPCNITPVQYHMIYSTTQEQENTVVDISINSYITHYLGNIYECWLYISLVYSDIAQVNGYITVISFPGKWSFYIGASYARHQCVK